MGVLVERMRYTNHEKLDLDLDLDEDGDDFDGSGLGLGLERLIDRNIFDILTIIWDWWSVNQSYPSIGFLSLFFYVWYSHLSTTSTTIISTTGEWGKHCFFSLSFLDCSCFGLCSSFCIC